MHAIKKSMELNSMGVAQLMLFIAIPLAYILDRWALDNTTITYTELLGAALIFLANFGTTYIHLFYKKI